ncbi:MAG: cytochrome c family protein [Pseudomonadota bacterium]
MDGLFFNKLLAGILVAGIIAMVAGMVARAIINPVVPEERAYYVEVIEDPSSLIQGPQGPEAVLALLSGADVANGQKIARTCATCHTFGAGEANKVGPNLWQIIGAPLARAADFKYSKGLLTHKDERAAAGFDVWDYEALNHFLFKPKTWIPGTSMAYVGLKKVQDRADIIAYLRSLSDSPAPLPSAEAIAAEAAALAPPEEAAATDTAPEAAAPAARE